MFKEIFVQSTTPRWLLTALETIGNGSDSLCTTNYVPNTITLGDVNDHFGFCSHESDGIHVL